MKLLNLLIVSVVSLLSFGIDGHLTSSEFDFQNFVVKHSKEYHSSNEYHQRLSIFQQNVDYINNHNSLGKSFTLDINEYTDLTHEEFKLKMLGHSLLKDKNVCWAIGQDADRCISSGCQWCDLDPVYGTFCAPQGKQHCFYNLQISNTSVPTSLDWRTSSGNPKNIVAVTEVKNQQQCGSCWSFSASGATEGAWAISGKPITSLSEQQLVDCSSSYGNNGCGGGDMDAAFQYIMKNGLCTESSYPYKAVDGTCKTCTAVAHLNGYNDIPDENGILSEIQKGPVSVAIEADQAIFQFYSGGVLDDISCGNNIDHAVLIVGYGIDQSSNKPYYIIKNSWGSSWGESGYFRMVRNKGMCGIGQMQSRPYYLNKAQETVSSCKNEQVLCQLDKSCNSLIQKANNCEHSVSCLQDLVLLNYDKNFYNLLECEISHPLEAGTLGFDWSILFQCVGECGSGIIEDIIKCAGDLSHIWEVMYCVADIVGSFSSCGKCICQLFNDC